MEKKMKKLIIAMAIPLSVMLNTPCVSAQQPTFEASYAREDFRIRDPFILAERGVYYLYESGAVDAGLGVCVRRSKDLDHWTAKTQVMHISGDRHVKAVWAPEVHKHNGLYFLFVTLTLGRDAYEPALLVPGREKLIAPRGVWVYKAQDPMGPFTPVKDGPVTPRDWMALDGTLYIEDDQPYMVFCHEWCQIKDGRMCYAPLAPDFASFTAAPAVLFNASESTVGAGCITDGPFLYRSPKSGALYMIWSNTMKRADGEGSDYCIFTRTSPDGRIAGPWSKDEILFRRDGGHGMIFKAFDGRLMLALHQPNVAPAERMVLFEIKDIGAALRIVQ